MLFRLRCLLLSLSFSFSSLFVAPDAFELIECTFCAHVPYDAREEGDDVRTTIIATTESSGSRIKSLWRSTGGYHGCFCCSSEGPERSANSYGSHWMTSRGRRRWYGRVPEGRRRAISLPEKKWHSRSRRPRRFLCVRASRSSSSLSSPLFPFCFLCRRRRFRLIASDIIIIVPWAKKLVPALNVSVLPTQRRRR